MYLESMIAARQRTEHLGFGGDNFTWNYGRRYIDEIFCETGLSEVISKTFHKLEGCDIDRQCVPIHFNLLPELKRHLNCNAHLTLGSVYYNERIRFEMSDDYIKETLRLGITPNFKFHCWITLDSTEIIDLTLASTLGSGPNSNGSGHVLAIHPDHMNEKVPKLEYVPMLLGPDYLKAVGISPESGRLFSQTSKNPRSENVDLNSP